MKKTVYFVYNKVDNDILYLSELPPNNSILTTESLARAKLTESIRVANSWKKIMEENYVSITWNIGSLTGEV